tara:strand:+ start:44961 stop:46109 length:1149 start_codon:yes stop_codon:yes gene_type:complete
MKYLLPLVLLILIASCSSSPSNVGFITKLGNDTLAVETFSKTDQGFTAKVVLRSPRTELAEYDLKQDEFGGIIELTETKYSTIEGFDGEGMFSRSIMKDGDSLYTKYVTGNGEVRSYATKYDKGALPFIDMVHWPFELALNEFAKSENDTVAQKMISGNNISTFIIANLGEDKRTIRHPSRGVMDVWVNSDGQLVKLDAAQTTRKLVVNREEHVDIESIGKRFLALDRAGKSFGSLSGGVEDEFEVNGAIFKVKYGSPSRRGRVLFGGIVPWGERWRTGADGATHFSTSKELMIGNLKVPVGEYTLFTIPEVDGGILIINKQTGQNGQTYNAVRDLGRVPMQISTNEESTEAFTIVVEEEGSGAKLKLMWGETVFSVPFSIN